MQRCIYVDSNNFSLRDPLVLVPICTVSWKVIARLQAIWIYTQVFIPWRPLFVAFGFLCAVSVDTTYTGVHTFLLVCNFQWFKHTLHDVTPSHLGGRRLDLIDGWISG